MSFVDPRPEVPKYVALWHPERRSAILSVRPGITDPASIGVRNEADEPATAPDPEAFYVGVLLQRKTATYVDYVNDRTFLRDLKLLGRTADSVLRH